MMFGIYVQFTRSAQLSSKVPGSHQFATRSGLFQRWGSTGSESLKGFKHMYLPCSLRIARY